MRPRDRWKSTEIFVRAESDSKLDFCYYKSSIVFSIQDLSVRIENVTRDEYTNLKKCAMECDGELEFNELLMDIFALSISNPCIVQDTECETVLPDFWNITPLECIHCREENEFYHVEGKSGRVEFSCCNCSESMYIHIYWCESCSKYQPYCSTERKEDEQQPKYRCVSCESRYAPG